jgi:outer membrane protein OmpA-like peptidoglycan-associated protein
MVMKKKLLLYIFLLSATVMQAQKEQLKKADRLFNEYAFPEAAEAYREYLKKERKPSKETIRRIADTYYYIREYGNAVQYYERLYKTAGYTMEDDIFNRYIQSLLMDGNVKKDYAGKADELLRERLGRRKDKTAYNKYLQQKKTLDSINAGESRFTVTNIKANSDKADFGTAFYGDKIVYSSSKDEDKTGRKIYKWNEQPFLELFVADRDTVTGDFINEEKFFPKELNNYHNATVTFTPDLKTVYFSNNNIKKSGFLDNAENGTNNLRILKAEIEDGKLINETSLKINKITYSVSHPALTPDGKWMFFTSDMPGGEGETDIYMAKVMDNGQLSDVKNLGKKINTTGKEGFPFVQNGKLYFASNGHYGMGGLDVYLCDLAADMKLSEPVNMGAPVNTNMDDFAFIISKDETYGYLSSNRKKGRGDDDIYYFTVKPEFIPKPEEIAVTETDTVVTTTDPPVGTLDNLIRKEGDAELIDVNPIYFDLDKYDITPRAEEELAKVIYVMKNFPSVVIKIESHTDSRQTHKYNITLSENRARSTYNYLVSKGIDPARIESYKGYGETRLKNRCSDDVPCTEEEHQLNRRSDFVIVKR